MALIMTPYMLQRENFDLAQVPAIFDVQVILEMLLLIRIFFKMHFFNYGPLWSYVYWKIWTAFKKGSKKLKAADAENGSN